MGTLLLTSNGFIDKSLESVFKEYCLSKKVLIIDNATQTGSNKDGVLAVVNSFNNIGIYPEIITLNSKNIQIIFDYDVCYISGGDLKPFLNLFSSCNVKLYFLRFLHEGKTIIGESVGSIIFGKDCRYYYDIKRGTKKKYDEKFDSYKTLGITDYNIFPHFNKINFELREKIIKYEHDFKIKITQLNDGEYIKEKVAN